MEAEQEMEVVAALEPVSALQLLQNVYRNPTVGMTTRMRAAICLPFEVPKLAVVAQITENDLATLLDRRLRRLEEMKNGRLIEAQPEPDNAPSVEVKAPTPSINFRSLRRRI